MSKDNDISIGSGARVFGFFTVMLILTLDASNGKDLLDVLVPYIQSISTCSTGPR